MKKKIIRITTVPISMALLLNGQLEYMSNFFEIIGISSSGEHLDYLKNHERIKTFSIEMSRSITPFHDLISLTKLIYIIIKERPDIVHSHTPKAGTIAMVASWICRVPIRIHTVAGLPLVKYSGIERIILDFVEKITYACATKVYPNSFGLKDIILQNKYCSESKIHVIGNGSSNGINTEYFSSDQVSSETINKIKEEYRISRNDFVYIFIGRLVKDKGIDELVKAFNNIYRTHSNVKLLLIGNRESELDPLQHETEQFIQNHPAIILTGFQSDIRPFLSISNVLTFPSYREGFPNVVLQAGAMGLPSIVSNINGCNEIIEDGINGILIPPKNASALEKIMIELFENDEKRNLLAQNARPLIVTRYEQQMVWQLLKLEYDEQLKKANIMA